MEYFSEAVFEEQHFFLLAERGRNAWSTNTHTTERTSAAARLTAYLAG